MVMMERNELRLSVVMGSLEPGVAMGSLEPSPSIVAVFAEREKCEKKHVLGRKTKTCFGSKQKEKESGGKKEKERTHF